MQVTIDKNTLIQYAHQLKAFANKKEIRRNNGKDVDVNLALQMICQGLFQQPYEAVKVTLDNLEVQGEGMPSVFVIHYDGDKLLFVNGQYVTALCPGTDLSIPEYEMFGQAEQHAKRLGVEIQTTDLPLVLGDEWEAEDVRMLAEKLGLFTERRPLWVAMYESRSHYLFDGMFCMVGPDGDPEYDEDAPYDTILWHAEYTIDYDRYEHFISVNDILNAQRLDDNRWRLYLDGEEIVLTLE